ncbi:Fur family transcriptional regulator [Microbacterium trichothecenolyticum]|uniref:Transcriptional regulator FurA n=1 Tax=Microbacterium trichothecenolyticum TaxID=69370 RepID=A0A0M2HB33_MICTR|nr:Fur family transcriptional regulator [Microbacterium trichothecenolyticum]KJL41260.1 Transcriptional regulator FurA [Microbacterium trichothecenolyticum]
MAPHTDVEARAVDTAARLRAAGLRVTDSRRAVVDALIERPHASADELFAVVARTLPATSLQSVYNALGDFVDAGLARRIEPAGRPGLFELRVDDNHHHLICSRCGAVEDVDCVVGEAPCLTPSDAHGYAVQVAEVTFWGVCPACAQAAPGDGEPAVAGLARF